MPPTPPPRLLDAHSELDDAACEALREFRRLPDGAQVQRVVAGLAAVGVGTTAASAASGSSALGLLGSFAATAKLLGPSLLGGLLLGTAMGIAVTHESVPAAPYTSAPVLVVSPPRAVPSQPQTPQLVPPSPSTPRLPGSKYFAPTPSLGAPSAATPPELEGRSETALLLEARRASPEAALRLCEEHRARFGNGALAQERELIAIEALSQLGRRGEAQSRAQQFIQQFPGSAHRARVERLISETK